MSQDPSRPPLRDIERSRLEQIRAQFAAAWQGRGVSGGDIFLSMFLPPQGDSLRLLTLEQLIAIDLEHRWDRGEHVLLEDYVRTFPELGTASSLPASLICAEYRARSQRGTPPPLETYQQRFPDQFPELRNQIEDLVPTAAVLSTPVVKKHDTMRADEPTRPVEPRKLLPLAEGYQLVECIGRGSFGEVWRGIAPGGVEVAIKIIHWTESNKLTQVELRALELVKRLRHAFLLQVQAYWLSEGSLYIVMDLAERTLLQRSEQCRRQGLPGIPVPELIAYMREAAEALDYLHANQVLHRDVKPANILIGNGHARLADFGLARLFIGESSDVHATMIGTPLYMGPEVWERKVGPTSDQYSLASTYAEMRLGRRLFAGDTQKELMLSHLTERPDLRPLGAAEQRVLLKALAKKSEERFPNCVAFVRELEAAVLPPAGQAKQGIGRRMAIAAVIAVVGIAGGIALGLNGWRQDRRPALEMTVPGAIEVTAGTEEAFEVHVLGARSAELNDPEFLDVPPGVAFTAEQKAHDATSEASHDARVWRIGVTAALNAPPAAYGHTHRIKLRSRSNDQVAERVIELGVRSPVVELPAGCRPSPGATLVHVEAERRNYWNRIERQLPDDVTLPSGKACQLVLIPSNSELKLPSFYMLEDKVWNEFFAAFETHYLRQQAAPPSSKDWPDDWRLRGAAQGAANMPAADHPLHPVMGVNLQQAKAFAAWLGGALPSCAQWDTAAGRYEKVHRQGPFRGDWNGKSGDAPEVAVQRAALGTLPVGTARDDVSALGCRDMAGNGDEWTRDESDPAGGFSTVILRGRRYDKERPLLFDDLRDPKQLQIDREDPAESNPYIGFRIVIEPTPRVEGG